MCEEGEAATETEAQATPSTGPSRVGAKCGDASVNHKDTCVSVTGVDDGISLQLAFEGSEHAELKFKSGESATELRLKAAELEGPDELKPNIAKKADELKAKIAAKPEAAAAHPATTCRSCQWFNCGQAQEAR